MIRGGSRRYLLRTLVLTYGLLSVCAAFFLLVVAGGRNTALAVLGGALMAIGFIGFVAAVADAWVVATFPRSTRPSRWFGYDGESVAEEANRQSGWKLVPEAATDVGWNGRKVRRALQLGVIGSVALLGTSFLVAAIR